jgi:DNA-binding NtrC family response regulator
MISLNPKDRRSQMMTLRKKTINVLIVDDEECIRDILSEYLNTFGFEVTCAENGKQALALFTQGQFDLVISDLMMQPMDGMELLAEIHKIDPDIIFMMVTGFPSIESAMAAIKNGAKDFISKPFNLDEIKLKIERALMEKSLLGRLKNVRGIAWALLISIPIWLFLGIFLARSLK